MGRVERCLRAGCTCAAWGLMLPAAAGAAAAADAAAACPDAQTPAVSVSVKTMRQTVVCLINRERTSRGLPRLTVAPKLNSAAQRWTNSMVTHDQFSHARFVARINAVHYRWRVVAENIATGYPTAAAAVSAWMASPDHCRNILDPEVRNVGTGERPAAVRSWASGPATWTQDFGLKLGQAPASHEPGPASRCPYRPRAG